MPTSKDARRSELLELSKRDPQAVLRLWREAGGVPPGGHFEADVNFEQVVVPAILASEFARPKKNPGSAGAIRDKTKVNPATGAEDERPARPLETVPPGKPAKATNAEIPGTGD